MLTPPAPVFKQHSGGQIGTVKQARTAFLSPEPMMQAPLPG
ncbi:hypothetical protein CHCC14437_2913 [Bacillus licheniformis]|nr:hypothetical protein CHCC14437_2913 [Bacillus licheniformis]